MHSFCRISYIIVLKVGGLSEQLPIPPYLMSHNYNTISFHSNTSFEYADVCASSSTVTNVLVAFTTTFTASELCRAPQHHRQFAITVVVEIA